MFSEITHKLDFLRAFLVVEVFFVVENVFSKRKADAQCHETVRSSSSMIYCSKIKFSVQYLYMICVRTHTACSLVTNVVSYIPFRTLKSAPFLFAKEKPRKV